MAEIESKQINEEGPRRRPISPSVVIFAVVAISLGAFIHFKMRGLAANGVSSPASGKQLGGVKLKLLTGSTGPGVVTDEQLLGRVTVINFWGYWCPPCVQEYPHLQKIRAALEEHEDFQFLLVSCHPALGGGDEANLRERTTVFFDYADSAPANSYSDLSGVTRKQIAGAIGSQHISFPCTVLVDRERVIRGVWIGYSSGDPHKIQEEAARLLKNKPPSGS
ncbi:MAG: TlpA disulfide reductase family protein [Pirellulaceae bacterium]|jgi:thiol-disulfide isomerase/thioredoxin|nr:TlpA disulfide reductase family protein [Pirellulaceae bacterium]MDP7017393.1 TlpA disulfide reductase family protein [Pirellulaceae bacterium]